MKVLSEKSCIVLIKYAELTEAQLLSTHWTGYDSTNVIFQGWCNNLSFHHHIMLSQSFTKLPPH